MTEHSLGVIPRHSSTAHQTPRRPPQVVDDPGLESAKFGEVLLLRAWVELCV